MSITFAPRRGAILLCDFDAARVHPEMDKKRQAIVISATRFNHRHGSFAGLCTVVPTSSKTPRTVGPEDVLIPTGKYWSFSVDSWVRCKMVTTVSHDRLDLLLKDGRSTRTEFLDESDIRRVLAAIRHIIEMT